MGGFRFWYLSQCKISRRSLYVLSQSTKISRYGGSRVWNSPTFYGQVLSISQIIPKSHAAINTTYNTIYATALHTYLKHIQYEQMYKMCVLYIVSYKFPPHWTMLKGPSTVHPPSLLRGNQLNWHLEIILGCTIILMPLGRKHFRCNCILFSYALGSMDQEMHYIFQESLR